MKKKKKKTTTLESDAESDAEDENQQPSPKQGGGGGAPPAKKARKSGTEQEAKSAQGKVDAKSALVNAKRVSKQVPGLQVAATVSRSGRVRKARAPG